MTLLRLSPDSERLRRIAKAHAAGELSTPDYRRIRAEVIDGFAGVVADAPGDDTEPRWLYRPIAPTIKTDPPLSRRKPGGPSPFWAWLFAVVVFVLVIYVTVVAARGNALMPSAPRDPSSGASARSVFPTTAVAQLT